VMGQCRPGLGPAGGRSAAPPHKTVPATPAPWPPHRPLGAPPRSAVAAGAAPAPPRDPSAA
jgi:hypothetical protein